MKTQFITIIFLAFNLSLTSQSYLHTANSSNTNGNRTYLKVATNTTDAIIVSHNWKASGPYNNSSICVKRFADKIEIVNTNGQGIPDRAKYNVFISKDSRKNYKHVSNRSNTSGHITFIENPRWLRKADVKLLVTHEGPNKINNNPVGIYYTDGKWAIYNQNRAPMKEGTSFYVYECNECALITASSPSGNFYDLQESKYQNNPNQLLFVTQYWTGVYNKHEVGVWYNKGKWSIFNQDRGNLPANSQFLVARKNASSTGAFPDPKDLLANAFPTKTKTSTPVKTTTPTPTRTNPSVTSRNRTGKIKVSLSGISVDDHQENTWGSVEFCVQKKNESGQWVDVVPVGKRTAWQKWSRSKTNPLMCYPYPKYGKLINNIQKDYQYEVDMNALGVTAYRIKYKTKLTCNHKDNFAASDGDHSMKSIETDYIKLYVGDRTLDLYGKKFKTASNREHTFQVQFASTQL